MARAWLGRERHCGTIDALASGALRERGRVCAGADPLTGKRRNPRTNATVDQLLDRYLPPCCEQILKVRSVSEPAAGHGSPRVWLELRQSVRVGRSRVGRIMRQHELRRLPGQGINWSTSDRPACDDSRRWEALAVCVAPSRPAGARIR